jgi:molybdopterin-guanine dinucleotide biosynthesis protein A
VPSSGPLPGVYARRTLATLERALDSDRLRLRAAIATLDVVTVDLDPALLVNVNAPDDVRSL